MRENFSFDLTYFVQPYLQNYSSENFEILTRSVFESQLQKTLNEPYAKKSSLAAKIERTSNLCAKVRLDQLPTIISSKLFIWKFWNFNTICLWISATKNIKWNFSKKSSFEYIMGKKCQQKGIHKLGSKGTSRDTTSTAQANPREPRLVSSPRHQEAYTRAVYNLW